MAKSRKDNKGRVLRKGETQRKCDGKYVYTYIDPEGRRRSIYAKDIMVLRKREEQLIKDQLDGLDIYVSGTATINYVFERYIALKTEIRKTTIQNYRYMYDRFVRPGFGRKKIADVKYSDVMQFYQHLLKDGKIQINTLDNIHTILHPTFQLAVRDNIIRNNPSDGVMRQIKKGTGKNKGIRHALTLEQQRAFLGYIASKPEYCRWESLFTFLMGTGCRIGEAIGIRWEDVDFEQKTIDINHALVYYSREYKGHPMCSFVVSKPKTDAGTRKIPMIDACESLQEELERQQENGFNTTIIDGMTGFIFTNRFGNVHNPQAINRAIKRIYESYNAEEVIKAAKEQREPVLIPHFSCHHLRHTFCSRFCENETNLKVIQSIMGHASIETTMDIYAEVSRETQQEAMKNLSNNLDLF